MSSRTTLLAEIVGRDEEVASVQSFVADAHGSTAALVLVGEAGIGKSTLWLAAVEHAHAVGCRVLSCRPAQAESRLAYAALADILESVLDDVLPRLSPPRRRALESALLLVDGSGGGGDDRAVAVAVRDALQIAGKHGRLLIAIDDVQWLDTASAEALAFALRRLQSDGVAVLIAQRGSGDVAASPVEAAFDAARVQRVWVGPLSLGALHRLLRDKAGRTYARQTLVRVHERTSGNPFYALQVARLLDEDVGPLEPLPIPETLEELLRERIGGLPADTRRALAFASALGTPSAALLERAGVSAEALDRAVAAQVIVRDHGAIRFTHPLLSSVLYGDLGDERHEVHERIAAIVADPLVRAQHLALAQDGPDAAVASELDAAAKVATGRGAHAMAAELAEHALRLTPPSCPDDAHRRALATARLHLADGEWPRARTIAADLLADAGEGGPRAEALLVLSEIEVDDQSVSLLEEALRDAAGRPALESLIYSRLAWARRFRDGFDGAVDDDALEVASLSILVTLETLVGEPGAPANAERAYLVATRSGDPELMREAIELLAILDTNAGRLRDARERFEQLYADWRERDEGWSAGLLWSLAWIELWSGRWELAAQRAADARDISIQYGRERSQDYIPSSWIALHRGLFEQARSEALHGLELSDEQIGFRPPLLLAVAGLAALWSGDPATAAEILGKADGVAASLGWGEASWRPWTADYAEALLALGRVGEAVVLVDAWEADARRLDRPHVLAAVTRCRGLAAAADGKVGEAVSLLEDAVSEHVAVGDVFGRSRSLLALGAARRRLRQKRAAREALDAALAGFEELGAPTWAELTRAEIGRIGGRSRQDGLTEAERRIATLVAQGRTNSEVAAALFLAERTVAGHLTRIYVKLGIRSRTELARRLS